MNAAIGDKQNRTPRQSIILQLACLLVCTLVMNTASAIPITGNMGVTGSFGAADGTGLADATMIALGGSVMGTGADGDLGSTVFFFAFGTSSASPFSINPASPVVDLLQIGGWQLDLDTLAIVDQTAFILTMNGTGFLSGNAADGFEKTAAIWSFSGDSGGAYSMTITAVPPVAVSEPGILTLLGIGLIAIAGWHRRLRNTLSVF